MVKKNSKGSICKPIEDPLWDSSNKLLEARTLEIHYFLSGGSHAIDAKAFYACQQELVELIEFIAKQFDVDISVETIALDEGGIRSWLKANGASQILVPLVVSIVGGIIVAAPSEAIKILINHWVSEYIKSLELQELEKKRTERELLLIEEEIDSLKRKANKFQSQTADTAVRSKRSKFYEYATKAENLQYVKFIQRIEPQAEQGNNLGCVYRDQFPSYKLASTEIDPIEVKSALIEVISPVLTKGKRKWVGNYPENPCEAKKEIRFSIQDEEFLKEVWSRKVSFSNGSVIQGEVQINRKVNDKGEEAVSGYEVLKVFELLSNGIPQTLSPRRKKKAFLPDNTPSLFPELDE